MNAYETPFDHPTDGQAPAGALPLISAAEAAERWEELIRAVAPRSPLERSLLEQAHDADLAALQSRRLRDNLQHEALRRADRRWCDETRDDLEDLRRMLGVDARAAVIGLTRFAAGARYLVSRWTRLESLLRHDRFLAGNDRREILHLQGYSAEPYDVFHEDDAYLTWRYCFEAGPIQRQVDRNVLDDPGVMPLKFQLAPPTPWPPEPEFSRAQLQAIIDRALPPLVALAEELRVADELPARAAARDYALALFGRQNPELLRELRSHERAFQQGTARLEALRRQPTPCERGDDSSALAARRAAAPEPPPLAPETPQGRQAVPQAGDPGTRSPGFSPRSMALSVGVLCAVAVHALLAPAPGTLPPVSIKRIAHGNLQERIKLMSDSTTEEARPGTSEARIRSNRENSLKSTGPRTEAGKNRSKYNNLSHGMCARTLVVLPDECPDQAARDAQEIVEALGASTGPERRIALKYAGSLQTVTRCEKAEGGALRLAINGVLEETEDRQRAEAARLGGRLVEGIDLEETILQLRSTPAGCSYLLEQFRGLAAHLDVFQSFEPVQFALCLHLGGRRPGDWFRDGVVRDWTHAYVFGLHGDRSVTAEEVGKLLHADRPTTMSPREYLRHAERLIEQPIPAEAANAILRGLVAVQIKDLTERRALLALRAVRDREDRLAAARVDGSPEGRNRRQYAASAVRTMKALRIELEALQALRKEGGDEPETEEAPEAGEEIVAGTEANAAEAPEEAGGSAESLQPAGPVVVASLGALALGAWEVIGHFLE